MPDEEKVAPEETKTDDWDKERQRLDQLSANVTKIASEKAEIAGQLTAMTERSQEMQDTVARLEKQLSSAQTAQNQDIEGLDPDMYDDALIKKVSGFEAEIANTKKLLTESNAQIKSLVEAKDRYETDAASKVESARKADRKEKILSDLDGEYGAKYRNEALKLAQEEVDRDGKAPDGEYEVAQLLRKHYKELSKPTGGKSFSSVAVDTGDSGVAFNEGDIEEGSRNEVLDSIRNKIKGKSFTMPKI